MQSSEIAKRVAQAMANESARLDYIEKTQGIDAAKEFATTTKKVYLQSLRLRGLLGKKRHHASLPHYRPGYVGSCLAFRAYLSELKMRIVQAARDHWNGAVELPGPRPAVHKGQPGVWVCCSPEFVAEHPNGCEEMDRRPGNIHYSHDHFIVDPQRAAA